MTNFTSADHQYMTEALRLAEQGLFTTTPNPRVGCLIVKNGRVVGKGAHKRAGEPHAEILALREAGHEAKGSDVYVTLEPCSHFGRTPPCADALIKAEVKRVIVAMQDPNPKVAGSGMARLNAYGIDTCVGLMESEANVLNSGFVSRMNRSRPFVRCKIAASLDGRTALSNSVSKWITSEAAREDVQYWRARSCAILTGIGTVIADNPSMSVRKFDIGRQPLKVVVDSKLRISSEASILSAGKTLIAYTGSKIDADRQKFQGAELIHAPQKDEKVDLEWLLAFLAQREINDILVEAGNSLNGKLLEYSLIDELIIYYAPLIMGQDASSMFSTADYSQMSQCPKVDIIDVIQLGKEIRIRAKPLYQSTV